jgi:hypothetical protein
MDIKEQLLVEISRINSDYIAAYINRDPKLFKELMDLVFESKHPIPMRASWVASIISDAYPDLLLPYVPKIISQLKNFDHTGVRRNFLRYLATIDIPESIAGGLFDDCYNWLLSRDAPPAVKVHSMQIIYNISRNEPDLLKELSLILDELKHHESAAIRSRSNEIRKKIRI